MSHDLAVIFDLDGLLADTEPLWSESSCIFLRRRGLVYDPSLKPLFMGRHPMEVMTRMITHYGLTGEPGPMLEERLQIQRSLYERGISPMPGARELVLALAERGIPMAVASGSPTEIIRLVLKTLDLLGALSTWVGSDQVQRGKPAPDLFLLAAARLGAEPSRCVVLEDSTAGVEAAVAAGMRCVAVPSPETPLSTVAGADLVVQSLSELSPEILTRVATSTRVRVA
jgi:HAD superfamily hydrolase (TIGR01509 family)